MVYRITRKLEDYEILIPNRFRKEIEDSMGASQPIFEPLDTRIRRKPQELKAILVAVKIYVINFSNNAQQLEMAKHYLHSQDRHVSITQLQIGIV